MIAYQVMPGTALDGLVLGDVGKRIHIGVSKAVMRGGKTARWLESCEARKEVGVGGQSISK